MWKYLLGLIKNLFNPAISIFALVDVESIVDKKAKIAFMAKLYKTTIGRYSYVCQHTNIVCADIGQFCSIGPHCSLGLANHTMSCLSTSPLFSENNNALGEQWTNFNSANPFERITIGNDVWIGNNVIVKGGIMIGNGAVIGAGAVVTKDIPPYGIAVGVPAKVVRYRFNNEHIELLQTMKWWDADETVLKKNISLFQTVNLNEKVLDDIVKCFKMNSNENIDNNSDL